MVSVFNSNVVVLAMGDVLTGLVKGVVVILLVVSVSLSNVVVLAL